MDLKMDLVILTTLQFCFSGFNLPRLVWAQLLLSGMTVSAQLFGSDALRPFHMPVMLLCCAAATGERRCGRIFKGALCMLALSAAGAGCAMLWGRAGAFAGVIVTGVLLRRSLHPLHRWNIEVQLELGGACASFPALIDTGNRLKEHHSGLPVLIVETCAAGQIAAEAAALDESRLRKLPFGVLGSAGEISCFRPDRLRIALPGRGYVDAPGCWAAIYQGRIPGSTRALAPPEFFDAIEQTSSNQDIQDRARRVFHGFFKCKAIHLRAGGADSQGFGLLHRRQRPAASSADPRGGDRHGAQGACGRYAGALHHDRT